MLLIALSGMGAIHQYNWRTVYKLPVDQNNPPSSSIQNSLATLTRWAFFATLVFTPMRWRTILLARPNGTIYKDYTDFLLFIPDITLAIMFVSWGLFRWIRRAPLRLGPMYVWIPLAGLTTVGLLSVFVSVDRGLSLYHAIRFVALFVFYLYLVNERISMPMIGAAVGLQGTLQSEVAIAQSLLQHSVGLKSLGEYELDPQWAGVSIISDGTTNLLRAYGLADHPNILGGCLAFGLLILLVMVLQSERKYLPALGIPFVLMCLALFLTFSRAAWLAFLTGAALIVGVEAWTGRRENLKFFSWLALAALMILLPFFIANRNYLGARLNVGESFEKVGAENRSMNERILLNESANRIFAKHPLTGIGLSASPIAMQNEYPTFPTYYQPPHFVLLAVALETGLFGAAFYFLLIVLPWVVLLRRRRLWTNPAVIGAAGLLFAITVVGFFDYYTWFSIPGRLWQWLAWGLFATTMETSS